MSLLGNVLITLAMGQLCIYLVQGLPIVKNFGKPDYFRELFQCSLCLGTWVYFALVIMFRSEIITELAGVYVPVINELLTAMSFSLTMHLMMLGAKIRWGNFND